jgi:hypothetical protein
MTSAAATAKNQPVDRAMVVELIERIEGDLARLKGLLEPPADAFDPADPRNKTCDGKLTPDGVETCYRLFDEGKSRYSVARAMKISFAAATHRFQSWMKEGGAKRRKPKMG